MSPGNWGKGSLPSIQGLGQGGSLEWGGQFYFKASLKERISVVGRKDLCLCSESYHDSKGLCLGKGSIESFSYESGLGKGCSG